LRVAVFTGNIDPSIKALWNRINLAMIFHCTPSAVGDEFNIDTDATKIILAAKEEMKNNPAEGDDKQWS